MKTLVFMLAIFTASFVFGADGDSTKVTKRIMKKIIVDENGEVTIDSTVSDIEEEIEVMIKKIGGCDKNENVVIMRSPCKGKAHWTNEEDYNVTIDEVGDSMKVMVIKSPHGDKMHQFKFDADKKHKMMMFHDGERMPFPPAPLIQKYHQLNTIDLNDPNIENFERETMKDGKEKITIIRKKRE